jgi:uncharacterized coiled-coil protein SlyX
MGKIKKALANKFVKSTVSNAEIDSIYRLRMLEQSKEIAELIKLVTEQREIIETQREEIAVLKLKLKKAGN